MLLFREYHDWWIRAGAKSIVEAAYAVLQNSYCEPHRAYHTLDHVAACLAEFRPAASLAKHPLEAEMALWYHDIIYEPRAHDNEERSAQDMRSLCRVAGLPDGFAQRVESMILATKHKEMPTDPDAQLVVDCDLSILGKPEAEFDAYDAAIRKEYSWAPEQEYRRGRAAVLSGFLARRAIYSTAFFRERYEQKARENIARALLGLIAK